MNLTELKYKDLKTIGKKIGEASGEKINTVGMSRPQLCFALKNALSKHGMVADDFDDDLKKTVQALIDGDITEPKGEEAPETTAPAEITDEQLISLAGEMNTILALEPVLDTALPIGELKDKIIACAKQPDMIRPTDEFSTEAWATLRGIGAVAPLEKGKGKGGKGPKETKAKAAKEPKAKKETAPSYTRVTAAVDALRADDCKTYGDLIAASNALYMKAFPDKDNTSEARFAMGYVKQALFALGICTFDGRGDDAKIVMLTDIPARPANLPKAGSDA